MNDENLRTFYASMIPEQQRKDESHSKLLSLPRSTRSSCRKLRITRLACRLYSRPPKGESLRKALQMKVGLQTCFRRSVILQRFGHHLSWQRVCIIIIPRNPSTAY